MDNSDGVQNELDTVESSPTLSNVVELFEVRHDLLQKTILEEELERELERMKLDIVDRDNKIVDQDNKIVERDNKIKKLTTDLDDLARSFLYFKHTGEPEPRVLEKVVNLVTSLDNLSPGHQLCYVTHMKVLRIADSLIFGDVMPLSFPLSQISFQVMLHQFRSIPKIDRPTQMIRQLAQIIPATKDLRLNAWPASGIAYIEQYVLELIRCKTNGLARALMFAFIAILVQKDRVFKFSCWDPCMAMMVSDSCQIPFAHSFERLSFTWFLAIIPQVPTPDCVLAESDWPYEEMLKAIRPASRWLDYMQVLSCVRPILQEYLPDEQIMYRGKNGTEQLISWRQEEENDFGPGLEFTFIKVNHKVSLYDSGLELRSNQLARVKNAEGVVLRDLYPCIDVRPKNCPPETPWFYACGKGDPEEATAFIDTWYLSEIWTMPIYWPEKEENWDEPEHIMPDFETRGPVLY